MNPTVKAAMMLLADSYVNWLKDDGDISEETKDAWIHLMLFAILDGNVNGSMTFQFEVNRHPDSRLDLPKVISAVFDSEGVLSEWYYGTKRPDDIDGRMLAHKDVFISELAFEVENHLGIVLITNRF